MNKRERKGSVAREGSEQNTRKEERGENESISVTGKKSAKGWRVAERGSVRME